MALPRLGGKAPAPHNHGTPRAQLGKRVLHNHGAPQGSAGGHLPLTIMAPPGLSGRGPAPYNHGAVRAQREGTCPSQSWRLQGSAGEAYAPYNHGALRAQREGTCHSFMAPSGLSGTAPAPHNHGALRAQREGTCPSQSWRPRRSAGESICPLQSWRPERGGACEVKCGLPQYKRSRDREDGRLSLLARTAATSSRGLEAPNRDWTPLSFLGSGRAKHLLGHSRSRNYKAEFASCRLEAVPLEFGDYHPLKPITVTESKTKKVSRKGSTSSTSSSSSSSVVDPLSSVLDGTDPLSMFAATAEPAATDSSRKRRDRDENSIVGSDFEPWASKRGEILARYTTTEKLSINLFMGSEKGKAGTATSAMSEKVRTRLEELDDFEEGSQKELLNLTQQDYVNRIEELNQSLKDAWASDQKVKALKIVIQDQPVNFCLLPAPLPLKNWDFDRDCVGFTKLVRFAILTVCSKLLSDTSVIQFYPSKFVLITDILDTFGKLVYERIFSMCVDNRSVLPDHFSPENVNDTAKETCLNWFFKIASIRELIPRFYVEASILKCNKFLSKMGISECLPRLTCMIRGIGDPLVSVYARAYLCRVGMEVAPHLKESLNKNFFDFLLTFKQIHGDTVQNQLVVQGVELPSYLPLYSPAMDWIFQCISYHAPEALLTEMMERCKKLGNNALLLNSVMSAFRAEFIATRSMDFIGMIKECDESGFPKHLLFRSLGLNLALADPPEGDRLQILNEAWKVITKLKNPQDYINCAEVWVEYTCKHFTKREVNTVLADVIKHMTPDRAFEDSYPQLQSIIKKVIAHFHDFSVLFSVEKFLPFLDMFQKESVRVEVCKCIMEVFIKHQQEPTKDPVILNALLHVCKTMHDSVNALTLEDEKRMLAYLINGFIKMVSFGRDFEQQLSFYVEARSMFCNLEPVLVQLIHSVNRLAMETRKVMKGNHSRKTAAFVRACVAYCFITIPSLVSIFTRLNLYLHSGQVALANQCLSQADAFFKAAISLIPEVPKMINIDGKMRPSESFLLEFLCNFFSTLLIVPDHPEHGVLFLVRELLNVIQDYTWEDNGDDKIRIYTCVLHLLSAMSQETYLYHIDKVDSNDSLYGGDSKFLAENNKLCETVMAQILEHLKTLAKDEHLGPRGPAQQQTQPALCQPVAPGTEAWLCRYQDHGENSGIHQEAKQTTRYGSSD
ncbi:VPS35 endosomal protein-sorting factor-like isoform X2 [Canis lupus familiaris]|uniref:VPS35 endosomal protein-sorting factor-like isoform X2 n=1 Tax=Canis lupus familiaris TaxID=9615 RepID=UPI0018F4CF71|nr:VPS35 endosomal protein-sorting factor-like isoform X2 [Canis lupus familiaris]